MKHHIAKHQQRSLTHLSYVGKSTAILAWGLCLVYTVGELYMWLFHGEVLLNGILQALSDYQPLLAEPDFKLSKLPFALLILLDLLPIFITSLVWLLTGLFFLRLSRNELWTSRNFKILWAAGILNIISPFVYQLCWTLQSLAVSLDLPLGGKIFVFSLGLSTNGVNEVVIGIILCAFAWMIRESIKIHEENALYI